MGKAYWVATYRSISDPDVLGKYAGLASQVIEAHGGRFLARGTPVRVYEAAAPQRCVIVEFDSAAAAMAAYESKTYEKARAILQGSVEREILIVEGV
jgi:uncharacterized protein (DUF1330 family)